MSDKAQRPLGLSSPPLAETREGYPEQNRAKLVAGADDTLQTSGSRPDLEALSAQAHALADKLVDGLSDEGFFVLTGERRR